MKAVKSWIRRGFTLVGAVIIVLIVADFNQQLMELSRLKEQLETDEALLAELTERRDKLLVLKDYAASDKAVEDFARQEGYMAKPGDIVYVVRPEYEADIENERKVYTGFDEDQTNIERWLFWLFGE
jgi:cell division protein FtsB